MLAGAEGVWRPMRAFLDQKMWKKSQFYVTKTGHWAKMNSCQGPFLLIVCLSVGPYCVWLSGGGKVWTHNPHCCTFALTPPPPPTPLHLFHTPSPSSTALVRSTLTCMKRTPARGRLLSRFFWPGDEGDDGPSAFTSITLYPPASTRPHTRPHISHYPHG